MHRALRETISYELSTKGVRISPALIPLLGYLSVRKGGPVSQREMADVLEFDRHRTSRAVKELTDAGWLSIEPNPENRRENMVSTTQSGRELCTILGESARAAMAKAFAGCPNEDIETTLYTLKQILNNLSDYEH